jgi:acyl-coenzyme A synthetase/AMP-(fatty) acid ligase/acyl carrier protein
VRELGIERLLNLYGTTEEGIVSLVAELPAGIDTVTVGYPLPGSRIGVVGLEGQRVPPGVPGEVVAGGIGVSRGYLGRPALTAAAFRPDPAAADGGRRYYTGDRGRWTASGVEMLGRLDNQVKIRGHRVELGEIEIGLTEADGVAEAAAVLISRDGTDTITAYVRLREGSPEWDPIAFRASLRRRLPSYMVPGDVVLIGQMPYTQSGKVDRKALAARSMALTAGSRVADGTQVPQPGTEQAVADVWAEMLGVPEVGRNDRWFDIGGDSLMAARMTRQLTDLFGVSIQVSLIYEEDRLASFATDIEAVLRQEGKMV